jgi:acetylglutamate/LysW-gamma-L-alpha-aminoadipate kinase
MDAGYFPVLTPPGASTSGDAINVDGDRASAMVAGAFKAAALVILTDTPGLLRSFPDESTLVGEIPRAEAHRYMQYAEGRMKKKVMGAVEAIAGGVARVIFADGRIAQPITQALAGGGTHIA